MERWVGRVALVTGASAGIGAGIVRSLVHQGMRVVGVARRDQQIKDLATELRNEGAKGELHAVRADLTKEDDILNAVSWVKKNLGGIDVLVNNAGIFHVTPLTGDGGDKTPQWRTMLDLNLMATCILTREVITDMRTRGVDDGHIIHIGSIVGTRIVEFPGGYMYAGTKHALRVMTEGLRRELRDLGTKIRVTSVSPGLVNTDWWAASGLQKEESEQLYSDNPSLKVEDVAEAVVFALSRPPHVQIHQLTVQAVGEKFQ